MGYGSGDTSGGNRGNSGSGGAFTGGGLQTPSNWYGTKAHFGANGLRGYSSNGQAFRNPMGQVTNSNFQTPAPRGGLYAPLGIPQPVAAQPLPPPIPPAVPPPIPPRVPAPPAPPMPPPAQPRPPVPAWYGSMFMRNPTGYPQHATGWRQGYGSTETPPGESGPSTGYTRR